MHWPTMDCLIPCTSRAHSRRGQRRSAASNCTLGAEAPHCCRAHGNLSEPIRSACSSRVHDDVTRNPCVTGNALEYQPHKPVDIIVSSLMTHHLEDTEIIALLRWMETTAQVGWFINDLERSEQSSRMLRWLERVMRWHRFVRHDGPVSFRRAFREEDWVRLLKAADVPLDAVTVEHWRPGRLCVGRWI